MPIDFELCRQQKRERFPKKPAHMVVTIRLSPELHRRLKERAHAERISLNTLCIAALQEALPPPAPQVVFPGN